MFRYLVLPLIISFFAMLAAPQSAHAGKKQDIELLQRQVAALQRELSSLAQNTGQSNADMTIKISNLEQQNQRLTGEVESLRYQLQQMNKQVDTLSRVLAGENFSGLVDERQGAGADVAALGATTGGVPAAASRGPASLSANGQAGASETVAAAGPPSGPGVTLPLDPDAAYEYASSFLLSGDYERARQAFELYVEAFPNARQTPDARFRLGEIYLATGANSDAAQAFINHIKLYPNNPRAPEAYLKLGTAFSRLEKIEQACNIYKQVRIKFPNASPIILQRTDLEMQRNDCR